MLGGFLLEKASPYLGLQMSTTPTHFPTSIKFKYSWRSYQQRVLDELDEHLDDNHLHVIAPPGSGKTVLGLEVMLRLNKPTLILAPTRAIRNQWIDRFCALFLETDQRPDWISDSIKEPRFVTVSTYQGLHAACTGSLEIDESEEEEELEQDDELKNTNIQQVIALLQEQGMGTIVIDEAHHLKNAWWQSIIQIKNELRPTIVGLTATPPYDVSYTEWSRYIELNGPVDTEISVPELIKEGDLCPHQDYVMISSPTDEELSHINKYRDIVDKAFVAVSTDKDIIDQIVNSSLVKNPEQHLDWIYGNMKAYSSILIFLGHNHIDLDVAHFKITGNKKRNLPTLTKEWLEVFISYYLSEDFEANSEEIISLKEKVTLLLERAGILEKGRVNFTDNKRIEKFLTESLGKLQSIIKITQFELDMMQTDLRQVILCDFIRKEYLSETTEINKLGVVPVFETLRRNMHSHVKIGILTGSLIVIPASALQPLSEMVESSAKDDFSATPLPYDSNYLILRPGSSLKNNIVSLITELFESGEVQVLVGTKSLLGEGWDAPSINTLILASFIGSFVLSNQMRGRAIRTHRDNIHKSSNIWHLVCHDPTSDAGGSDLAILERRFKGFVGISERELKTIESGISRLLIPYDLSQDKIEAFNRRILKSALERELLIAQWHEAIANGVRLVEELKIPFNEEESYKELKEMYLANTIKYLLAEISFGLTIYYHHFVLEIMARLGGNFWKTPLAKWVLLVLIIILPMIFFGRAFFRAARLYLKYRDISKDIAFIARALLNALLEAKIIHTDRDKLRIHASMNSFGEVFCHLEGGSTYEKSAFIKALQEIVSPVHDPRYLIIRQNLLWGLIHQRDYHSVPEVLGKHKTLAIKFEKFWRQFVGRCKLVFTKNAEGRSELLKARFHSLASEFQEKSERTNRWE